MDRKISRPPLQRHGRQLVTAAIACAVLAMAYGFSSHSSDGQYQQIGQAGLQISVVEQGVFQDTLAVRGQIMPKTTVYLDSVAGGVVEQRLAEHGDYVEKGQPLLRLSNTALQLEVMSREAQVTEQLNFLRNTQMTMETNRLNLKRDLLETELQIRQLKRKLAQSQKLLANKLIAADTLTQLQEDLAYYEQRRLLTLEQQMQENTIREQQLAQLEDSARMLQSNLQLARSNLDNLLVRAPVSGYLSELSAEVGESKERGARFGQIDLPGEFKLVLQLDEFYLNQISRDLTVRLQHQGQNLQVPISKVDSRVTNALFQVEVALPASLTEIRRGQSLDAEIVLGSDKTNAMLLPRGAFFASSGGNWVYVLSADGSTASRRNIRLGKRNQQFFEVLDGLVSGERVIISGYQGFDQADTLKLK
jgi:HlyD family secretion protein